MKTLEEMRAYHAKRAREWRKKKRIARIHEHVCANCQKGFVRDHKNQTYCSRKCQSLHYQRSNKPLTKKWRARYYAAAQKTAPWIYLLMTARARAKKQKIPCDLDTEWVAANWTGHCAVCQLPFVLGTGKRHPLSPSIDQIDPKKGYTKTNSRFVAWAVNAFKGEGTDEDVYLIATAIVSSISRTGLPRLQHAHNPSSAESSCRKDLSNLLQN